MTLREAATFVLLAIGTTFMLLAAIGVLRMPDLFMRMQAATKAAALGAGMMFLATIVHFWEPEATLRAVGAIVFVFLTLPLGAHLMSRAAYLTGVQIWQGTKTGIPDPYDDEHVIDEVDRADGSAPGAAGDRKPPS